MTWIDSVESNRAAGQAASVSLRRLGAIIASAAALSCDSTPTEPDPCTDVGIVGATVTLTPTTVTFDWSPNCAVAAVSINSSQGGVNVWAVTTPGFSSNGSTTAANVIRQPIVYGQVPSGAVQTTGPVPLTPGTNYALLVSKILPASSSTQCFTNRIDNVCVVAINVFQR